MFRRLRSVADPRRLGHPGLLVPAALLLVACGPEVTVTNNATIPVRVILHSTYGGETLAPSPGESSTAELGEGPYSVTVIPDEEWVTYAKLTRKVLNDRLADAGNLTGPQLLDLIHRLKAIALQLQTYEDTANKFSAAGSCGGQVTQDTSAAATVQTGASGALTISCK